MINLHPSAPQPTRFIDPKVLTTISSLELVARTVVEGFISGLHRSPHLGFSVNFAEYRPYRPGDDIRKIDWKVYGKTDRFYLKEYEGETNTSLILILDCSRSMTYGTTGPKKVEYGKFLAASLAYFAFKQRDSVGFISYDDDVLEFIPARGSIGHLNTVLHTIEHSKPGHKSEFFKPFTSVAERLRKKGMIAVISDLYDNPDRVIEGLRRLAFRGNDIVVFHVLDPMELRFDFEDSAQFIDMETRAEMHVVPEYLRQEYIRIVRENIEYYERECRKDNIDYCLLETSLPLDQALFSYLLRRQQLY